MRRSRYQFMVQLMNGKRAEVEVMLRVETSKADPYKMTGNIHNNNEWNYTDNIIFWVRSGIGGAVG